jgi:hypothetical protein
MPLGKPFKPFIPVLNKCGYTFAHSKKFTCGHRYPYRYSNEYRFRPAASPVITEQLSDGRTKIRGARHGDHIPVPTPTPTGPRKPQRKKKGKKRSQK